MNSLIANVIFMNFNFSIFKMIWYNIPDPRCVFLAVNVCLIPICSHLFLSNSNFVVYVSVLSLNTFYRIWWFSCREILFKFLLIHSFWYFVCKFINIYIYNNKYNISVAFCWKIRQKQAYYIRCSIQRARVKQLYGVILWYSRILHCSKLLREQWWYSTLFT